MIRDAVTDDVDAITEIYNHYIQSSVVTFEEECINASEVSRRIGKIQRGGFAWLVAEEAGNVIGYAYSSMWKERSAYRNTAEVTVYLREETISKGWGAQLYGELFTRLRASAMHVAVAGITLPNAGSVALHEKFGMQKVAHFEQVGYKFGQWLDVGYWQVQLSA